MSMSGPPAFDPEQEDGLAAVLGPRRVLMTTDAVGGVWDYALELSSGLADVGIEVVLAVMGPPPGGDQRASALRVPNLRLELGHYKLEWMDDPWSDVAAAGRWLLDLEARHGCDLVHLNGFAHGALPFRSPKLVVAHSCVLSWWRAVKKEDPPPSCDRYRRAVTEGLRAADQVVAPTHWMLAAVETSYGPIGPRAVIPNGRALTSYGPAEKAPFVLCAGRLWDEAKNAAAVARVAGRLPWPVKIVGGLQRPKGAAGEDVPTAETKAELLGRVPAPDLAALYAEAAIYTLPARYEPFGLTVLEAALSECALVLGDIPSLRELWDRAAIFVDPGDDAALELALLTLMNQPELTALLAIKARRRALRYASTDMVKRYLTVYRRLARRAADRTDKEMGTQCAS